MLGHVGRGRNFYALALENFSTPLGAEGKLPDTSNGDVDERKAESFAQRLADMFVARMCDAEFQDFRTAMA
jgi:hypothetical protein